MVTSSPHIRSYLDYFYGQLIFLAVSLAIVWLTIHCLLGTRTVWRVMSRLYRFVRVRGNKLVIMGTSVALTRGKIVQCCHRQSSPPPNIQDDRHHPQHDDHGATVAIGDDDLRMSVASSLRAPLLISVAGDSAAVAGDRGYDNDNAVVDGDGDAIWSDTEWYSASIHADGGCCCSSRCERCCDWFLCRCRPWQRCHGWCASLQSMLVYTFVTNIWTCLFIVWSLSVFQSSFSYDGTCPDGYIDCWRYDGDIGTSINDLVRIPCPSSLYVNDSLPIPAPSPVVPFPSMFCYRWVDGTAELIVAAAATSAAILQLVIGQTLSLIADMLVESKRAAVIEYSLFIFARLLWMFALLSMVYGYLRTTLGVIVFVSISGSLQGIASANQLRRRLLLVRHHQQQVGRHAHHHHHHQQQPQQALPAVHE